MDPEQQTGTHQLLIRSRIDIAAAESLYRGLAPGLLAWFRLRVADAEAARDLLAETFAQMIVSVARYRGTDDRAAQAWVWGIARNLLRRYYRHQRVEVASRRRLGLRELERREGRPLDEECMPAIGAELHAALDALPVLTRACVWMRLVDEMTYHEIAVRQGCSAQVVRQRVSRGLRQLANALKGSTTTMEQAR